MNRWTLFFDQLRKIGKVMVKDDLHDFGYFTYKDRDGHKDHPSPLHHWQYGTIIWALSEYLTLLNMFFPFDQKIRKSKIQTKINSLTSRRKMKIKGKQIAPKDQISFSRNSESYKLDLGTSVSRSFQVFSA